MSFAVAVLLIKLSLVHITATGRRYFLECVHPNGVCQHQYTFTGMCDEFLWCSVLAIMFTACLACN